MNTERTVTEVVASDMDVYDAVVTKTMASINCCLPGIITSFDGTTQTASIKPAITRKVKTGGITIDKEYPILVDVPVLFLGGGMYSLTFPVVEGDECIVLFSDVCIDAWFQSGSVQNQSMTRSHSLSDGFAIVGFRSAVRKINGFNSSVPEIGDIVISGKRMSEWIESVEERLGG